MHGLFTHLRQTSLFLRFRCETSSLLYLAKNSFPSTFEFSSFL
jgi:hypothetical protein